MLDKSAGTNYPISAYPLQHINSHPIGRSHELRMFPSSNQPKESSTGTVSPPPVFPSHISPIAISPQQLEGVPVLPPAWNPPTSGSLIGSTDLRQVRRLIYNSPFFFLICKVNMLRNTILLVFFPYCLFLLLK